ncbi:MAG: hypothetical protein JEZ02_16820 [Desulfatibacillum sp.]|nr:hypothetical protein [Desulfatibacillum sp.]
MPDSFRHMTFYLAINIVVSGNYAYVTLIHPWFGITLFLCNIDISNPKEPTFDDSWYEICVQDMEVKSDFLIMACENSMVKIVDISKPKAAVGVGVMDFSETGVNSIAIQGNRLYVADGINSLWFYDISDLKNHDIMGSVRTPEPGISVAVSGNHAFVAGDSDDLQVIDISDPKKPTRISEVKLSSQYEEDKDVAIAGDFAYITNGSHGLQIVDISDPKDPFITGSVGSVCNSTIPIFNGITIHPVTFPGLDNSEGGLSLGELTWGSGYIGSSISIDFPQDNGGSDDGWWNYKSGASTSFRGVAVSGNYAYVTDSTDGLQIIDITDPTSPFIASSLDIPGSVAQIAINGNYAYAAVSYESIQIIDISDPLQPRLMGKKYIGKYVEDLAVSGDYAYVACYYGGLQIVNVADPEVPFFVGSIALQGYAQSVTISNGYAYMAKKRSGTIEVIDISAPGNPRHVSNLNTPTYATSDLVVSGNYLYGVDHFGLVVYRSLGAQTQ